MSTIQSIRKELAPELEALNARIREQLGTDNQLMQTIVDNYLQGQGKLLRPIIVILAAKLLASKPNDDTFAAAASVELLHNASLIHDDVVDNSPLRRGKPTINMVWDNHIAVLVGDYFVSSAMQQAISTGDIRIIDALCGLGKQLSLGELDQIYNARYHTLTEDAYLRIIDYKTASLFVVCAKMGAYSVGASDADLELLGEFAQLLGLCFQIRDDILDYYDDPAIGKPTANDLREGKITLPLLHVLLDESAPNHAEMVQLSQKEELSDDEIATLYAYAIEHGGIQYARQRMRQLRDQAAALLDKYKENENAQRLIGILDSIIEG